MLYKGLYKGLYKEAVQGAVQLGSRGCSCRALASPRVSDVVLLMSSVAAERVHSAGICQHAMTLRANMQVANYSASYFNRGGVPRVLGK